jgi:IS30 family transposase
VEADQRSEIGHWEGDTIVSGTNTSATCLMTLTERKTRFEITCKIPNRTTEAIRKALNLIERQMGSRVFTQLFKTITVDNGSEFADIVGLETSALSSQQRVIIYFSHPFSSFERGTNENHNGIIRRFIPKGFDIGKYSIQTVQNIQDWMNSYPRRILRGIIPRMALQAELGSEFCLPSILGGNP